MLMYMYIEHSNVFIFIDIYVLWMFQECPVLYSKSCQLWGFYIWLYMVGELLWIEWLE